MTPITVNALLEKGFVQVKQRGLLMYGKDGFFVMEESFGWVNVILDFDQPAMQNLIPSMEDLDNLLKNYKAEKDSK